MDGTPLRFGLCFCWINFPGLTPAIPSGDFLDWHGGTFLLVSGTKYDKKMEKPKKVAKIIKFFLVIKKNCINFAFGLRNKSD